MNKWIISFIVILLSYFPVKANTYYLDATVGNDASPGTFALP